MLCAGHGMPGGPLQQFHYTKRAISGQEKAAGNHLRFV